MRYATIEESAASFDISMTSAVKMRIRYLQSLLSAWIEYIDEQIDMIPESDMITIINELNHIQYRKKNIKPFKEIITDDMIQKAREYPIDELIRFERGLAIAFCHTDKRPSLTHNRKNNTARCFPCNKTFNALDTLILRDGYSFIDAVKYLAGRS